MASIFSLRGAGGLLDDPGDRHPSGPIAVGLHERAGGETCAPKHIVTQIKAEPVARVASRQGGQGLGPGVTAVRLVRGPLRGRVLRCHRIEVVVVAAVGKYWTCQQSQLPALSSAKLS